MEETTILRIWAVKMFGRIRGFELVFLWGGHLLCYLQGCSVADVFLCRRKLGVFDLDPRFLPNGFSLEFEKKWFRLYSLKQEIAVILLS